MDGSEVEFLQSWYSSQCDGEWEHEFGIRIGTLDNPGWRLRIDLSGTELDGLALDTHIVERSADDWYYAWIEDNRFFIACGPKNLAEAIEVFRRFLLGRGSL